MGSDVVPGRTLLESKCKLPHTANTSLTQGIFTAPQHRGMKRDRGCTHLTSVSAIRRRLPYIPALLMGLTLHQMTLRDPCKGAAFDPMPQAERADCLAQGHFESLQSLTK